MDKLGSVPEQVVTLRDLATGRVNVFMHPLVAAQATWNAVAGFFASAPQVPAAQEATPAITSEASLNLEAATEAAVAPQVTAEAAPEGPSEEEKIILTTARLEFTEKLKHLLCLFTITPQTPLTVNINNSVVKLGCLNIDGKDFNLEEQDDCYLVGTAVPAESKIVNIQIKQLVIGERHFQHGNAPVFQVNWMAPVAAFPRITVPSGNLSLNSINREVPSRLDEQLSSSTEDENKESTPLATNRRPVKVESTLNVLVNGKSTGKSVPSGTTIHVKSPPARPAARPAATPVATPVESPVKPDSVKTPVISSPAVAVEQSTFQKAFKTTYAFWNVKTTMDKCLAIPRFVLLIVGFIAIPLMWVTCWAIDKLAARPSLGKDKSAELLSQTMEKLDSQVVSL